VLIALAVGVSILLVYAENRVYNPATPYEGGTGDHVHALALDPMQAQHMYLGTHYGFFRTRNGGGQWTRLNGHNGLSATLVATTISISPLDGRTAYVSGYLLANGNATGVFVTHDDGDHWQQLATGGKDQLPDPRILFVAAGWQQPGEVYAYALDTGLYRSTDGGQHWMSAAAPFAGQVTTFVPLLDCTGTTPQITGTACGEHLLVGTTQGLFDGTAGAGSSETFAPISNITGYIYAITIHRASPWRAYVSTAQGIFQATTPDGAFTQAASTANGAPTLTSMATLDSDPASLVGVTASNIVVTSHDSGQTWNAKGNEQLTRGISQLQSGLRSATGNNSPQWAGGQNTFLTLVQTPAQGASAVYVAISFPVQLFRSEDSGQIWDDLSQGG
jgi:hypothetical protein